MNPFSMGRLLAAWSRCFLLIPLCCCAWSLSAAPVTESHPGYLNDRTEVALDEDHLLVVEVSLGAFNTQETLFIYRSPDVTLIPVQPLMDVLAFPVQVDPETLSFAGWYVEEARDISVDILSNRSVVVGHEQAWPRHFRYAQDGFDLYIDQQSLERWFELRLELDLSQLSLRVSSDLALPAIAKLARDKRRSELNQRVSKERVPDDYITNQYDWLGRPQLDLGFDYIFENNRGTQRSVKAFSALGTMDLAKHSLRFSAVDNTDRSDIDLTLSKSAEKPGEFLLYGVDAYELGDLTGPTNELLFASVKGRGVHFGYGASSLEDQNNQIVIEGDATPGWEVELYRNGILLEFDVVSQDGRYRFESVETFIGLNDFEVRIYGPQGQYRTTRKEILVGGSMVEKGAVQYQTYVMERDRKLIASEFNEEDESSYFMATELSWGMTDYITGQLGLSQLSLQSDEVKRRYIYGALIGGFWGAQTRLSIANDLEQGIASALSVKTRILGLRSNLEYLYFDELISDRNPSGLLSDQLSLKLDGATRFLLPNTLNYRFSYDRRSNVDGFKTESYGNTLNTSLAGFQWSHSLNYQPASDDDSEDRVTASLNATRSWMGWRLKSGFVYGLSPKASFDSATVSAGYKNSGRFSYLASLSHIAESEEVTQLDQTLTWQFDTFDLSLTNSLTSKGFQSLGVSLNTSLGYDYAEQEHYFSHASQVNQAAVTVKVYLDEDGNGLFDAEREQGVGNVRMRGVSYWRNLATNDEGLVTLNGIPHLSYQKIEVDPKSLEDPFLKVPKKPEYIYTHAGTHRFIHIPLVPSVEIEGLVHYAEAEQQVAAQGLGVSLYDDAGELVAETSTEYDGVYLFESVAPGRYWLEFDEDWLARRGYVSPGRYEVFASAQDGVVYADPTVLAAE